MKPVAIFRHAPIEGPGYFATYLERHGIPWREIKIDAGEQVPEIPRAFSGLVFMGGPMSVNDDLPWIAPVLRLIRASVDADVPVLGHCLGGQLMAKALGGEITRSPVKEIGWGRVNVVDTPLAVEWFGAGLESFNSFHWHDETFSVPPGATRISSSPYCENQAFVLGPHLGMQFHVEMTPELIRAWCEDWGKEVESLAKRMPSVQTPAQMTEAIEEKTWTLNAIADRLYDRWTAALARGLR
ncbi:MAG: type 1 glutamine amidotransferase [Betaproteobacteria bacterium]|nr:type 1 glutamine amidotransferase [Betaproteobacteria bacterium]